MPTIKDVFDITDPYTGLRWAVGTSFALGTGICFLIAPGSEFWAVLIAGFFLGLVLLIPLGILLVVAVVIVMQCLGVIDEIRSYRAERRRYPRPP